MTEVWRISPDEARRRGAAGALLACAYEDEAKCNALKLQGAIPLRELERRAASLPGDHEIGFYCA